MNNAQSQEMGEEGRGCKEGHCCKKRLRGGEANEVKKRGDWGGRKSIP